MEKLLFGLGTTAIGMIVVFVGLFILILCIQAMHALVSGRKKEKAPAAEPAAPAVEETLETTAQDDDALIAVITAAIAAVWHNQETGFVVRRVRRFQNSSANARTARDEQMYSRL